MPAGTQNYEIGMEYDFGDHKSIWAGKKGFVSEDQYRTMKGENQKAFNQLRNLTDRTERGLNAANQWDATGLAARVQRAAGLGGMAGYDLDKSLVPNRSKAFTSGLAKMRENSPTGAAVGSVSNIEGEKIESEDAILDVGQGRDQFKRELSHLRDVYGEDVPGLLPEKPLTPEKGEFIPEGAYFKAPDGKVYVNKKGAGAPQDDPVHRRQLQAAQRFKGSTKPPGGAGNPYVPKGDAGYAAIPEGAYYIHPDDYDGNPNPTIRQKPYAKKR